MRVLRERAVDDRARDRSGSSSSLSSRDSMRESSSRSSIRLREPLGVALDELDEARGRLRVVLDRAQRLRRGAHGRERAAQLVRGVRDEIAPHRLEPAQLGHVDEHREHAAAARPAASPRAPAPGAACRPASSSSTSASAARAPRVSSSWLRSALRTTCSTDLPTASGPISSIARSAGLVSTMRPSRADDEHAFVHARQDAGQQIALGAQLVQAARKTVRELIERVAERDDLVVARGARARREIARGHFARGIGQLAQPARSELAPPRTKPAPRRRARSSAPTASVRRICAIASSTSVSGSATRATPMRVPCARASARRRTSCACRPSCCSARSLPLPAAERLHDLRPLAVILEPARAARRRPPNRRRRCRRGRTSVTRTPAMRAELVGERIRRSPSSSGARSLRHALARRAAARTSRSRAYALGELRSRARATGRARPRRSRCRSARATPRKSLSRMPSFTVAHRPLCTQRLLHFMTFCLEARPRSAYNVRSRVRSNSCNTPA